MKQRMRRGRRGRKNGTFPEYEMYSECLVVPFFIATFYS